MAKIDVLLPVKNGMDFLAESLDSICAQTFQDWRLLVLDHGSTDGSRELAHTYHKRDSRIEVHSFPTANGLSGLLNCGLDLCDCEYVMRHDADDVCFSDRMAVALAAFDLHPDCVAIGGQADVIDAAGVNIGDMRMPIGRTRVAAASLFRNPIAHPTSMLRFAEVQKLGVRYGLDFLKALPTQNRIEVPALAEDYFLFGQLAILGKCTNVPEKLIRYRWHGSNVSATRFHEQMDMSLVISRNLVHSFCAVHNLHAFDPAPFCNHGGMIFDVDGQKNFDAEFSQMADTLRLGFGSSDELERELRFRRTISTRVEARLLWRYNQFRATNVPETGEWNAIRSWMVRYFPGKHRLSTSAQPSS